MKKESNEKGCFLSASNGMGCCKVESIIGVDDRGQMVLPKEIREKAGIKPGDKLALVSWENQGKVCCMFLIKADELANMAKDMLGPIMKEIIK